MLRGQWYTGYGDLTDCHRIRREVFINEQNISEEDEMDGTDESAFHLVIYEGDAPVGTGRILIENGEFILGRIAVLKEYRGGGYGDFIVRLLIRAAFDMGAESQYVRAQVSAKGFYEKLGFVAYGDEYTESGIPRINMRHDGDV